MKTMLNIKTDPKLKKAAQKVAKEMGLSMSVLITDVLREIVAKQEVTFMTNKRRKELMMVQ